MLVASFGQGALFGLGLRADCAQRLTRTSGWHLGLQVNIQELQHVKGPKGLGQPRFMGRTQITHSNSPGKFCGPAIIQFRMLVLVYVSVKCASAMG